MTFFGSTFPVKRDVQLTSSTRRIGSQSMTEGIDPFGMFGDPEELQQRMAEMAEQFQNQQRVAWADNAIRLAVEMTVACVDRIDLTGTSDEQSLQVRDAI